MKFYKICNKVAVKISEKISHSQCSCKNPKDCPIFKRNQGNIISFCRRHEFEYSYGKTYDCAEFIVILTLHKINGFQIIFCNYDYEYNGRNVVTTIDKLNTKWWCDKKLVSKDFKHRLFYEPINIFIENCILNRSNRLTIAPPIEIFRIKKTIDAVRCFIAIRKFRTSILSRLPKDVFYYILIRMIWVSREDEIWEPRSSYKKMWKGILFDRSKYYDTDTDDEYEKCDDFGVDDYTDNSIDDNYDDYGYESYLLDNYIDNNKSFITYY